METFVATSNGKSLNLGSEYNKARFRKDLMQHIGRKYRITLEDYESKEQRGFFEGAVIPLWVYLDGNDYKSSKIIKQYREEAKREFNPEILTIAGKVKKVPGSTKNKLGIIEKVIDFMEEQYGIKREVVLNTELYKKYRDEIRPFDTEYKYETFIDYMRELNLI